MKYFILIPFFLLSSCSVFTSFDEKTNTNNTNNTNNINNTNNTNNINNINNTNNTNLTCGNGTIDDNEECEGTDFGGATCETLGEGHGTLVCNENCRIDLSDCSGAACGNGNIDNNEQCDDTLLNNESCESQGFFKGELACTDSCEFDTFDCSNCGDFNVNDDEDCDQTEPAVCDGWLNNYPIGGVQKICDGECFFNTQLCHETFYTPNPNTSFPTYEIIKSVTVKDNDTLRTPKGTTFVLGRVNGDLVPFESHNNLDFFIAKYNKKGDLVWIHQFGTDSDDRATDLIYVKDGSEPHLVVLGNTPSVSTLANMVGTTNVFGNGNSSIFVLDFTFGLLGNINSTNIWGIGTPGVQAVALTYSVTHGNIYVAANEPTGTPYFLLYKFYFSNPDNDIKNNFSSETLAVQATGITTSKDGNYIFVSAHRDFSSTSTNQIYGVYEFINNDSLTYCSGSLDLNIKNGIPSAIISPLSFNNGNQDTYNVYVAFNYQNSIDNNKEFGLSLITFGDCSFTPSSPQPLGFTTTPTSDRVMAMTYNENAVYLAGDTSGDLQNPGNNTTPGDKIFIAKAPLNAANNGAFTGTISFMQWDSNYQDSRITGLDIVNFDNFEYYNLPVNSIYIMGNLGDNVNTDPATVNETFFTKLMDPDILY